MTEDLEQRQAEKRFMRCVKKSYQIKGADGKKLCLVCDGTLPKGRRSYCTDECSLRNHPAWIAHQVIRRDKHTCQGCGDTKSDMEADHIVPVSEGGGLCGLDGYRTLCRKCHGKESVTLMKRLTERRKYEKAQKETGRLFA